MSTRDLIDAIESGNSSAIQQHFQDAIMSRVAERLDTMRIETAKNMFKSSVNENVDHEYLEQVLADNDINSQISGNFVHVDHDDVEKAQELVKAHGYDHKVMGGLNEVLSKKDPASKWIADFVKSDDPKFKGKTKKERIKMALGAYYGAQRNESAELDEAKKLIGTYDNGDHTAKVYHLSGEHNEGDPYHVKLFKDGKHYEPADYFTNDKGDAHSTAKDMVRRGAQRNESVELDETSCGTKKKWGDIKDSMKDSVKK